MLGKEINLKIQEGAEHNLFSYWEQYEDKSEGLGDRFVDKVYECLDRIELNPEIYQVRYDNIRCGIVDRFPFIIHYRIKSLKENSIDVEVIKILPQASDWSKKK